MDRQVTEKLLGAENQCSPALKKSGQEIVYWKRRLSSNGLLDEGTRDLGKTLNLPDTVQQPMTLPLCQFYLQIAWKSYRGIKAQARAHREIFLKQRAKKTSGKR